SSTPSSPERRLVSLGVESLCLPKVCIHHDDVGPGSAASARRAGTLPVTSAGTRPRPPAGLLGVARGRTRRRSSAGRGHTARTGAPASRTAGIDTVSTSLRQSFLVPKRSVIFWTTASKQGTPSISAVALRHDRQKAREVQTRAFAFF